VKLKVKELIYILAQTDQTGRIKAILSNLFNSQEHKFQEIINANLYENLKLDDLAFFAGLSVSSFQRKFKSIYGTSPKQYINGKRMEKAKSLLEKKELRISEVAFDCGFDDVAYFSKCFATAFKISPSGYRKSLLT